MTALARVDGFPALSGDVDLELAPGDVVLLRGPNGSGKTSLLRALAGLEAPLRPRAARPPARVAWCPQEASGTLVGLTVAGEFRLRGRATPDAVAPLAERETTTLSSGEARRVALDVADQHADVLLLDEPAEGLDADARGRLVALVRRFARAGAVVAADHGGALDGLATRELRLGATHGGPLRRARPVGGEVVLRSQPAIVRGRRLPAVALAPGVHALVGPNGSGKTTLLRRLAGLDGAGPARPYAPSDATALFTRASVREELSRCDPEVARRLVPAALLERHPLTLSGGEAHRLALAKALGRRDDAYLLDEPEAHLDADGRAAVADVVAGRAEGGACVVLATHDRAFVDLAHSVVALEAPR